MVAADILTNEPPSRRVVNSEPIVIPFGTDIPPLANIQHFACSGDRIEIDRTSKHVIVESATGIENAVAVFDSPHTAMPVVEEVFDRALRRANLTFNRHPKD